jgi:hypothetical protein
MWDINPENRPSIDIVLNIIEIIVKEERIENKNKCVIL